ncbi:MAG: ATP-grasp domain-containing protein [Anaerolineales bacterium]|jgi:predicted ATP-grasp superfamily ATP-dependent carboligase|nr:ATP-grasp domain-containing protein [Anaerolineales bacterium]
MTNILLTGGRAPATLELARAFHRAGHTVFMAESLRGHLSQPSAAVKAQFVVPAPRQESEAFLSALKNIIEQNQIEVLIPACEEVFHIAKGLSELPCRVFTEPLKKLDVVHNKWKFVVHAVEHELRTPETLYVRIQDDLLHAFAHWRKLALKPVYSRFAARTLVLPTLKRALATLTFGSPWVAQEFIAGRQYCTYSICHNGHVTAHTTYPTTFTAGQGAAISFQHVEHPAIFKWVQAFVESMQFTGQIAFDFIQAPDGLLYALECNPRATSGVHLLASHPRFVEAFFNAEMDCIFPVDHHSYMLSTAMLTYALPASILEGRFALWLKTFFTSSDVILDFKDPLPFLLQFRSIVSYLLLARREKISALEASTFDIEWNGEK